MSDIADDQNNIEELVVGHFDATLSDEQEEELAAELAASDSAKQLFLSYMRMEGRLHSLGRDGFLRGPTRPRRLCRSPLTVPQRFRFLSIHGDPGSGPHQCR